MNILVHVAIKEPDISPHKLVEIKKGEGEGRKESKIGLALIRRTRNTTENGCKCYSCLLDFENSRVFANTFNDIMSILPVNIYINTMLDSVVQRAALFPLIKDPFTGCRESQ